MTHSINSSRTADSLVRTAQLHERSAEHELAKAQEQTRNAVADVATARRRVSENQQLAQDTLAREDHALLAAGTVSVGQLNACNNRISLSRQQVIVAREAEKSSESVLSDAHRDEDEKRRQRLRAERRVMKMETLATRLGDEERQIQQQRDNEDMDENSLEIHRRNTLDVEQDTAPDADGIHTR
ncbi:hypothetical protein PQR68_31550 [Paraburkholderia agricolaris]|uniref:hypothetical protein n=1 Tax=Paraburkholderia agricolaris TaxID=2152888 RepID=UPI001291FCAB|nr:hypothetical protein [Paraburkholderia agricolaris]